MRAPIYVRLDPRRTRDLYHRARALRMANGRSQIADSRWEGPDGRNGSDGRNGMGMGIVVNVGAGLVGYYLAGCSWGDAPVVVAVVVAFVWCVLALERFWGGAGG